jgi:hypothetical protein
VQTLAVDRVHPFTVYVGTNRGVYRGRSTDGGTTWTWTTYMNGLPPADVRDLEVHPVTGVIRAATMGRSAYEVYTEHPIGSVLAAEGHPTLLRVHDVGTKFGPPTDQLDVEVVFQLDADPRKAFGFQLRTDSNEAAHQQMLDILRDAFHRGGSVRVEYVRTGLHNGKAIRVMRVS